jgi:hypothetical protein
MKLGEVSTMRSNGWSSVRCNEWSSMRCSGLSIVGCNRCVFIIFTMRHGGWFIVGCMNMFSKHSPWDLVNGLLCDAINVFSKGYFTVMIHHETWLMVHCGMQWTSKLMDCDRFLLKKWFPKGGLVCFSSIINIWPTKSNHSSYPTTLLTFT